MSDRSDVDVTTDEPVPAEPDQPAGQAEQPVPDEPAAPSRGGRLSGLAFGIAVAVILIDQASKYLAVRELTGREPVELVGELLRFRLLRNSGAAFSFATGMTWVLTAISATVCVVIVRFAFRLGSVRWALALGLLLGGALGNLLDRFFRAPGFARGHVVDFIAVPHYPVFNLADSAVVTGAVLIALLGFLGIGLDGRRQRA